jgi:hypothetical protein
MMSLAATLSTTEDTEDTEVQTFSRTGLFLRVLRVLRGGELLSCGDLRAH